MVILSLGYNNTRWTAWFETAHMILKYFPYLVLFVQQETTRPDNKAKSITTLHNILLASSFTLPGQLKLLFTKFIMIVNLKSFILICAIIGKKLTTLHYQKFLVHTKANQLELLLCYPNIQPNLCCTN